MLTIGGKILTAEGFVPGRIVIDGERIRSVEAGEFSAADTDLLLADCYIGPGLIDLQLNGALGDDFTATPAAAAKVAAYLPSTGVTGFLPTVITAAFETQRHDLALLADVRDSDPAGARILGTHLEGPYIAVAQKGAHDPKHIRLASVSEARELVAAARGTLRILTMAPELPGALETASYLREQGVIVSVGHSGASYEEALAGFAAGMVWVTHLFNAQSPIHHRMPGLPTAALLQPGLVVGLIPDGVHVHHAVCAMIYRLKGWEGISLVTDAMAALGLGPGRYEIGGQAVEVDATTARLAGKETLAGSIVTMNRAVANMMRFSGASREEAWRMGSTVPARLLGRDEYGELEPGRAADLVALTEDSEVHLTIRGGQIVYQAE